MVRPMRIEADESTSRDSHSSEDDDGGLCELQVMQFSSKRRPSAVPSLDVEKAAELAAAEMMIDDSPMASCSSSSDCSEVGHGGWHIAAGPETGTAKATKHDGEGWHILEGPAPPNKSTGLLVAATEGDSVTARFVRAILHQIPSCAYLAHRAISLSFCVPVCSHTATCTSLIALPSLHTCLQTSLSC